MRGPPVSTNGTGAEELGAREIELRRDVNELVRLAHSEAAADPAAVARGYRCAGGLQKWLRHFAQWMRRPARGG